MLTRFVGRPAAAVLTLLTVTAWNNGPSGNTATSTTAECTAPPYATHDWIADHARALLPAAERAWLDPHRAVYLIGTEAPDNNEIAPACGTPHRGYDDRSRGHSVEWNADWSALIKDRAAVRAREEYGKAVAAFQAGRPRDAAFYLGAMAHYIGDVSQYGHTVPWESSSRHSAYEGWAANLTGSFQAGTFEAALVPDNLVIRTPYTAAKRISRATANGQGTILRAHDMEALQGHRTDLGFRASVGASLSFGVNELADVLHTFYVNVVAEEP
ncbi:MAG: zinc dependent phospholipase C family protein [Gemmatimonadales bacterium]